MFEGNVVLHNANVITMNPAQPRASALAVVGGRIAAVGGWEDVSAHAGGARVIDLGGKTVLPGFIDTHVHFLWTAMAMAALDLRGAESVSDICEAVRGAAEESPEKEMIFGLGVNDAVVPQFGEVSMRLLLDEAAPGRGVYVLSGTGHFSLSNSIALERIALPDGVEGIHLDAEGRPNGYCVGDAHMHTFSFMGENFAYGPETWEMVPQTARHAVSVGLTTIHALEGGEESEDEAVREFLGLMPSLPLRFLLWYQVMDVAKAQGLGLPRIGGCILLDGDLAPRSAALLEPYTDGSGSGVLYHTQEEVNAFVLEAHRAGLQIAMHAVGDGAVEQALVAYEAALKAHPREDHRHRIEHAELITIEQIERAKRLGIAFAIQPPFNYDGGHTFYADYIGERIWRVDPVRSLVVDTGLLVAGGSDSFVTPLWPLLCVHSAVNHSNPAERIDVQRALELVTTNAARIGFEEHDKGSLETGKLGDIVVLAGDPFEVEPARLKDIGVEMTIVGGDVVYERP